MRRRALPLLLGALALLSGGAGCSSVLLTPEERQARILRQSDTPAERACREEAKDDPAARRLDRQVNPSADPFWERQRLLRERRTIEDRVFRDCLRRAGVRDPGGVEPVIPR
jgi:hypothetical protein